MYTNRYSIFTGISIISAVLASNICFADSTGWKFTEGKNNANSGYATKLPLKFVDDITPDQNVEKVELTKEQKHEAMVWGLSEQEEKRYVSLMNNRSKTQYKNENVSPVDILGINARTNEEREHYAEKAAKQEFERLAKLFAFHSAYNQQAEKLKEKLELPIVRKFDYEPFSPYNYKPVNLHKNDELILFVNTTTHARSIISALIDEMVKDKSIRLNIFFVDKDASKLSIQKWAREQNIAVSMAKSGQITLNLDNQKFNKLKTNRKVPVLILVRSNKSHFVDLSRF